MMRLDDRADCLKELGVRQWFARKRLPAAADSPQLVWPSEPQAEKGGSGGVFVSTPAVGAESVPSVAPAGSAQQSPKSALSIVNDLAPDSARAAEPVPNSQPSQQASENLESPKEPVSQPSATRNVSTDLHLNWRAYRVANWLVIDESAKDLGVVQEQGLLKNVLRACGWAESDVPQPAMFEWPVFNAMNIGQFPDIEIEALVSRWLDGLVEDAQQVLYLGREARKTFTDAVSKKPLNAAVAYFEYALLEMLNQPQTKAEFWRFLCAENLVRHTDKR